MASSTTTVAAPSDPAELFESEPRDDSWAGAQETLLEERVVAVTGAFELEADATVTCKTSCCSVLIRGRDADEASERFSSAGVGGWAPSGAFWYEPFDGGYLPMRSFCFDRSEASPPDDFVDRTAEIGTLRRRAAPEIAACNGLPGAPGHIELGLWIGADGALQDLQSSGDIGGTEASACVENAVSSAAEFAPANVASHVGLGYDVGAPQ